MRENHGNRERCIRTRLVGAVEALEAFAGLGALSVGLAEFAAGLSRHG